MIIKSTELISTVVTAYDHSLVVPADAEYLAIDHSGECYAYECEPYRFGDETYWRCEEHTNQTLVCTFDVRRETGFDWRGTKLYIGDQTR